MNYTHETRDFYRDIFKYSIGIIMTIGFFIILSILVSNGQYVEAVLTMVGALGGSVLTIVSYEFGSSRSSALKDENIALLNHTKKLGEMKE